MGHKTALIYGYIPNALGLCGPKKMTEKGIISEFLAGRKISDKKLRKIIENFKAASAYYQLIAKANNKEDFLEEKIVRAYWIGNDFLLNVRQKDFEVMAKENFFLGDFPKGSMPHHSFHVLNIGRIGGKLSENLLDFCLIKWGKVRQIANSKSQKVKVLVADYEPLKKRNGKFYLERNIEKEVIWNKLLAPELKVGDWVSIHWGNIMEKLTSEDSGNLKKYTKINLEAYF